MWVRHAAAQGRRVRFVDGGVDWNGGEHRGSWGITETQFKLVRCRREVMFGSPVSVTTATTVPTTSCRFSEILQPNSAQQKSEGLLFSLASLDNFGPSRENRPAWPPQNFSRQDSTKVRQVHSPSFSFPYQNYIRPFASPAFAFSVSRAFQSKIVWRAGRVRSLFNADYGLRTTDSKHDPCALNTYRV